MLKIGDDVGTQIAMMMSPQMYRQWFKPRHAAVIAAARAVRPDLPVCYHSDGNCWRVIPDLIEIGVTVLNPDPAGMPRHREGQTRVWRPAGLLGRRSGRRPRCPSLRPTRSIAPCSGRSTRWAPWDISLAQPTSWSRKCPGKTSKRICEPWRSTGILNR